MNKLNSSESFWQDSNKRGWVYQILLILSLVGVSYYFYHNVTLNLAKQNIASGFSFLNLEAGFEISEGLWEYWSDDSYLDALLIGVGNTFKVSVLGIIFALVLGTVVGTLSFSNNWLIKKSANFYVESVRNLPLLLQLFFWYALFTDVFPGVKEAVNFGNHLFLSQRGIVFTVFAENDIWKWVWSGFILSFPFCLVLSLFAKSKMEQSGRRIPIGLISIIIIFLIPILIWIFGGCPVEIDQPALRGFNFSGGYTLTPEFISLMLGLVLYTGAFIAEIVRTGILSVDKGQWEAASSLGLKQTEILFLVIFPQALRVMIPPLTSQMLNLTKNSSLAVGIGYPDFVSVANTTMNQTGQAIESVVLIMLVYLFFSLSTSLFMNFYNKKMALKER